MIGGKSSCVVFRHVVRLGLTYPLESIARLGCAKWGIVRACCTAIGAIAPAVNLAAGRASIAAATKLQRRRNGDGRAAFKLLARLESDAAGFALDRRAVACFFLGLVGLFLIFRPQRARSPLADHSSHE